MTLEGKVQGLGWEVSDDVGQVTSPEWGDTFFSQSTLGTIQNTIVWLVKTALLDHLILILDQKFDTLDWGSCGLKTKLSELERIIASRQKLIDKLTLEIPAAIPESIKSSKKFNFLLIFTNPN